LLVDLNLAGNLRLGDKTVNMQDGPTDASGVSLEETLPVVQSALETDATHFYPMAR